MPTNLTGPLTFKPIFMERMWGSRRLESEFGKKLPPNVKIGESWEIVDRPEAQSVVHNGPLRGKTLHELWTQHRQLIFGNVADSLRFPLLIKLLDAQEKLSLQVHPPERIAAKLGSEPKTEAWYVAAAEPGAELFVGLREVMSRAKFEEGLRAGALAEHVHTIQVEPGDAMFLPAGRLHAVGAGNLLVEIQQNSDTTYRIFDWNRVNPGTGAPRQLHIEQALECIDFNDVRPKIVEPREELLVEHQLFEIEKWNLDSPREIAPPGKCAIVCCLTGQLTCGDIDLSPGEFFLVPASLQNRQLKPLAPQTSLLRVTIP
jgi:mannose-6-phosphate isomerase